MDFGQIGMLAILGLFYIAYFSKMLLQRRKGIQTNQMGKGSKPRKTLVVEGLLKVATFAIVPAQIVSIALNTHWMLPRATVLPGAVIALLGVLVFIAAMLTMRDSWRAGIPDGEDTAMITSGLYRISRNPAFLGFDLMYLGTLIAFSNIVHLAFALFAIVMLHMQILEEERYLAQVFDEAYAAYKARTGRYFLFL